MVIQDILQGTNGKFVDIFNRMVGDENAMDGSVISMATRMSGKVHFKVIRGMDFPLLNLDFCLE
jgi:hypothetical protein